MKALNKPDWLLKWSVFITFITAICIAIATKGTIETVGFGLLVANLIGLPVIIIIMKKLIGLKVEYYIQMYYSTVISSLGMASIYILCENFKIFKKHYFSLLLSLICYVIILSIFERDFIKKIIRRCYV